MNNTMKKIIIPAIAIAAIISMGACTNNEGAFTEEQKTTQDSTDQATQDAAFDELMNDTSSSDTNNTQEVK
jgi:outer membrane murein-binding lipoprotein Lpp